ncbi:MAG: NUDIX hydrolase [Anaerolineaceae bacterium]|nr:NUDIX hydrolase [Anaerolineaceae bacterium]
MSRSAHYCPQCGDALAHIERHGRIRPVCPSCDYTVYYDPKVAVTIFIEQDEQVLLVQRKNDPGCGKWAMPAGFVEYDEAPEDAAIRETLEETGLQVEITDLLAVFPRKDHGLADIVISYAARVTGGLLQAGDDAAAAQWYTRAAVPIDDLVFYPSKTLIGAWVNQC